MNKVFNLYAKYYDLLYKDKDYFGESLYISKLIERFRPNSKSILDLGCGTGRHDIIFAENGFQVTGVELSERMIEQANFNKSKAGFISDLNFIHHDIRNLKLNKKFDIVISLFHVISYQSSNSDLKKAILTAKEHLKEDGLFIFDFWYGPAVLTERPEKRFKLLEDEEIKVERFADPVLRINDNIVDVNYTVNIFDKAKMIQNEIQETHSMRYLFIPEIKILLDEMNMGVIHFEEWMTSEIPDENSWSALVIAGNRSKTNL
ncbi:MAG TPA: class I SAM-dependent methyltransferase [Ignavibacteria bacterium]|nr:class I SAM-dependent methyltransferase [Ignavibacteria bacterium]